MQMGLKDADILRASCLAVPGAVKFQVFDSVPDFSIKEKIDNNTNTNINQRQDVSVDRSAERR